MQKQLFTSLLLLLTQHFCSYAQDLNYSNPQDYEIGDITVVGAQYADPSAIIALARLQKGQTIRIPSDQLSKSIHQLWKQRLFVDVQINITKSVGEQVFLEIKVEEYPRLVQHSFSGLKKDWESDLKKHTHRYLEKGDAATPAMQMNVVQAIRAFFIEKGFLDVAIKVQERKSKLIENSVEWTFEIDKGKRIPIKNINIAGNQLVKKTKLYKQLKNTKQLSFPISIFKPSRYIRANYDEDKKQLLKYYNSLGYRDAQITKDSVYTLVNEKGRKQVHIDLAVEEGELYKFGKINFKGNTAYSTRTLRKILGFKQGDIYNAQLLQQRLNFDPEGRDISTLYMDNGYLFFRINGVEKGINKNNIDLEIQISEGPLATIGSVTIKGNSQTSEHVIRRELRTQEGDYFSRSKLIRSQQALMSLGYFDPEKVQVNTPVNAKQGTVDIEYVVEEKNSDKVELSGGWGGTEVGLTGTVGLTLNNFSLRNMLNPSSWKPFPRGDGQRLSMRIQTNGIEYQSYNLSFTEPWLGGKKPNALSFSLYHTNQTNGYAKESSNFSQLAITGASLNLGTRLKWPDDFFNYQVGLNYQLINLKNYANFEADGEIISNGQFHNLYLQQTLSRSSIVNPIFPQRGAKIALSMQLTLPYSLLGNQNSGDIGTAQRYKWAEYHKWDLDMEWYTSLTKNLVLKLGAKMGFLGYYNKKLGLSPFERYELGGNGLASSTGSLQGRDIISLRGYEDPISDVSAANEGGAAIYNKYTIELRYLLFSKPSMTAWVQAFAEAGNAWSGFKDYNPFDLKRTVGIGARVHLPAFGTLGVDWGIGFDKPHLQGQSFDKYGAFNFVLGFEPK
ncbi:MAG: outer membrane protein assembly factor BamA [Aureispira sp.]|nr:outer membrane protein assembly factor BamA [Aureispira sp.]